MDQQLAQCVGYFTTGDWTQKVSGGLVLALLIYTAVTKNHVPGLVKTVVDMARKLLAKKK